MTTFARCVAGLITLSASALLPVTAPSQAAEDEPSTGDVVERSAEMVHGLAAGGTAQNAEAQYVLAGMAVQGHAPSQYLLGMMYRDGNNVFREPALAVKWLRRAAAQGHHAARAQLGLMAEQGDAAAHRSLGELYRDGTGIAPDRETALAHLRAAAEIGDVQALFALATFENPDSARTADLLRDTTSRALAALRQQALGAADDADPEDERWLAIAVERTRAAIRAKETGAVRLELLARYWIGLMHLRGAGVPVNTTEGVAQLCRAATEGLDLAQHGVGLLYAHGRGVPRDLVLARRWLQRAATQGHGPAAAHLAQLGAQSDDQPPDGKGADACDRMIAVRG